MTTLGNTSDEVYASVKQYYGKVLGSSKDLKTSACTTSGAPHKLIKEALKKIPVEITNRYYGCGSAVPLGIKGKTVLDLGSGSGQDCYVAAQLVGPEGKVVGVDMTDEQLDVARQQTGAFEKMLGWKPNLSFLKGYIEFLEEAAVKPNSVDVVISNCVINLSPRKELVLKSVYKVLREGGEFYFSDVYADRRLPDEIRTHNVLLGECLGGALYLGDFKRLCRKAGFLDPRAVQITPLTVEDEELSQLVGNTKFFSITYRLFKLANLEDACEDYGQIAIYKGTIPGHPHNYVLDSDHIFSSNKPMLVCGNTASMVGESWLKEHFIISGDRSTHYGLFDCGSKNTIMSAAVPAEKGQPTCSTGSCC